MIGPKIPGTTNRGRKKTISLDVPNMGHNSHKSRGVGLSQIMSNSYVIIYVNEGFLKLIFVFYFLQSKSSYVGLDLSGKSKEIASVDDAFYRYVSIIELKQKQKLFK